MKILKLTAFIFTITLFSCKKNDISGNNNSNGGAQLCKFDKISKKITSSGTVIDYYFNYTGSTLTTISGQSTGGDIGRIDFAYSNGNISKVNLFSRNPYTNSLEVTNYLQYTYTGTNLFKIELYSKSGSNMTLAGYATYTYASDGKLQTKNVYSDDDNGNIINYGRYDYVYNLQGNIQEIKHYSSTGTADGNYLLTHNNIENKLANNNIGSIGYLWFIFNPDQDILIDNGLQEAQMLSKNYVTKAIDNVNSSNRTLNFDYSFDNNGNLIQVTNYPDLYYDPQPAFVNMTLTHKCN